METLSVIPTVFIIATIAVIMNKIGFVEDPEFFFGASIAYLTTGLFKKIRWI